jgi:hypothetical protein
MVMSMACPYFNRQGDQGRAWGVFVMDHAGRVIILQGGLLLLLRIEFENSFPMGAGQNEKYPLPELMPFPNQGWSVFGGPVCPGVTDPLLIPLPRVPRYPIKLVPPVKDKAGNDISTLVVANGLLYRDILCPQVEPRQYSMAQ